MIRPVILHQLPSDPLGTVTIIEFLDGEGEAVIVAVVDAEDLKSGAVLIGMGEDDGRHGFSSKCEISII